MARNRILLVDDEAGIRFAVGEFLKAHEQEVRLAESCAEGEKVLRSWRADIVLCDYVLADGNALELLPRLKAIDPYVSVVLLTGQGSIELAVQAIKNGAEQFLTKPVELPALLVVLERLCEQRQNRQRQMATQSKESRSAVDPFVGADPQIKRLREIVERVAASDSPLLIQGETGTGKSVLASWIHEHGPRAKEAFVDLNCAGLSQELLETELFGHQKGAFTGAMSNKVGLLEVAHRGTVFLDEIGDVDPAVQPKLLKVVEEKRFRRLGDVQDCSVDVRLIAATHRDLAARVRQGLFRDDLYFRISTIPIRVPSLRERRGDVPALVQQILDGFAGRYGRKGIALAADAMGALQAYDWPGNIREMRNVLERAVLLTEENVITRQDLHFEQPGQEGGAAFDPSLSLAQVEKQHITRVLQWAGGQVDQAAKQLDMPRSTLYHKIKQHGIVLSKF
ncbi:MAG: sigma-54 dependent transcriptional regulator [Acidobacteriia bacterium]|nr:sigma-54 dependent transcriptional regulator [Terriglobia bacterium]